MILRYSTPGRMAATDSLTNAIHIQMEEFKSSYNNVRQMCAMPDVIPDSKKLSNKHVDETKKVNKLACKAEAKQIRRAVTVKEVAERVEEVMRYLAVNYREICHDIRLKNISRKGIVNSPEIENIIMRSVAIVHDPCEESIDTLKDMLSSYGIEIEHIELGIPRYEILDQRRKLVHISSLDLFILRDITSRHLLTQHHSSIEFHHRSVMICYDYFLISECVNYFYNKRVKVNTTKLEPVDGDRVLHWLSEVRPDAAIIRHPPDLISDYMSDYLVQGGGGRSRTCRWSDSQFSGQQRGRVHHTMSKLLVARTANSTVEKVEQESNNSASVDNTNNNGKSASDGRRKNEILTDLTSEMLRESLAKCPSWLNETRDSASCQHDISHGVIVFGSDKTRSDHQVTGLPTNVRMSPTVSASQCSVLASKERSTASERLCSDSNVHTSVECNESGKNNDEVVNVESDEQEKNDRKVCGRFLEPVVGCCASFSAMFCVYLVQYAYKYWKNNS